MALNKITSAFYLVIGVVCGVLTKQAADIIATHLQAVSDFVAIAVGFVLLFAVILLVWRLVRKPITDSFYDKVSLMLKFGSDKKPEEDWSSYWKRYPLKDNPNLFELIRSAFIWWSLTTMGILLVNTFLSVASFVDTKAQNQISNLLNRIESLNQVREVDWAKADFEFQLLNKTLTDPDAPLESQRHALESLPHVMSIKLSEIRIDDKGKEKEILTLPNLSRCRALLLHYMKRERVGELLGNDGFTRPQVAEMSLADVDKLQSMSNVSTELMQCLHRTGPRGEVGEGRLDSINVSLWNFERDRIDLESGGYQIPKPLRDPSASLDLRHLQREKLAGLAIPFFRGNPKCPVTFPFQAFLHSAQFQNALLEQAVLPAAEFRSANLQRADLRRANLLGAVFHKSRLSSAKFQDAVLQGAEFSSCVLDGVNFAGCNFGGMGYEKASKLLSRYPLELGELFVPSAVFVEIISCAGVILVDSDEDGSIRRARFSDNGVSAIFDDDTCNRFLKILENPHHLRIQDDSSEGKAAIGELKAELSACNTPSKLGMRGWSALLSERSKRQLFKIVTTAE